MTDLRRTPADSPVSTAWGRLRRLGAVCLIVPLLAGCAELDLALPGSAPKTADAGADGQLTKAELTQRLARARKAEAWERYDQALEHYLAVAQAGSPEGSVAAARLYAAGLPGVQQDYAQAFAHYQDAVDRGAGYEAELPLGYLHLKGLGVAPSTTEAERWFRRGAIAVVKLQQIQASDGSDAAAGKTAALVGAIFAPHVPPDEFDSAVDWVKGKAAAEGQQLYAESLSYRDGTVGLPDGKLARFLLALAAEKTYPPAAYELGVAHLTNDGDAPDIAAGLTMLWRAASADFVPAQFELARRYVEIYGDDFGRERAYYWLLRAQHAGGDADQALTDLESVLAPRVKDLVQRNMEIGWVYPP